MLDMIFSRVLLPEPLRQTIPKNSPWWTSNDTSRSARSSRFGSFKNLSEIQSSSTDVDANTSTFTFHKATYSSPYLDFSHNEIEDRSQQPLESMTTQVSSILTKYDPPPFASQSGQFPFIDIGGVFTLYTTSYDPAILKNLTWDQ